MSALSMRLWSARRASVRAMSTLVCQSGRQYPQGEVLRPHPTNAEYSIYKTQSEGQTFVYKRVSVSVFDQTQRLAEEFAGARYLRMPTDWNVENCTLVYPWLRDSLLSLVQGQPDFPKSAIKEILRCTSEAVKAFHDKDWIHIDIKPDNIMVDWSRDKQGNTIIKDAVLADFDIALKLKDGRPLSGPHPIGNILWRSPEGQTGRGVAKPSDVYSLALVYIYALGGGPLLIPADVAELAQTKNGLLLEILVRHFLMFGPLPEELLEHINHAELSAPLRMASELANAVAMEEPGCRFEQWPEDTLDHLDYEAKDLILWMAKLDPAARSTMRRVVEHSWWRKND
ncbi:kinase-like domain-containing protein [Geopyxis carbonaria]|nr:kinase-like domain-containing protein [Geopyxis carbonaria]